MGVTSAIAGTLRIVSGVDAHKIFGIWWSARVLCSCGEMLGFGVSPDASFFDYSCTPAIIARVPKGAL